jgi:hypothetical protein
MFFPFARRKTAAPDGTADQSSAGGLAGSALDQEQGERGDTKKS